MDCAATIEVALAAMDGIEVRVMRSAEDALVELTDAPVVALITDIQLPGLSGLRLVSQLRADARYSQLPMIVISGSAPLDTPARALAAGASAFFSKPFSPGAFRQKLEALLNGH